MLKLENLIICGGKKLRTERQEGEGLRIPRGQT